MAKIGIMGGTFDPIHLGHLILGESAYSQLSLSEVLFMPAGDPPHKREREGRATNEQRTEMVRLAIEGNPHFSLSLLEMHEEGYSYTYRTLEMLNAQHPENSYYFIMGADSLAYFDEWKEPQRIADAADLVVAVRDEIDLTPYIRKMESLFSARIHVLRTPNIEIASHDLRAWIAEGSSVRYYVPDAVREYIEREGIYRRPET